MGTRFEIVGYANSPSACEAAFDEAFREIEKLDSTLSNYKTDSELNLFCKGSPHEKPIKISKPMCDVLAKSQEISIQTNGSFDITIGPLTKLWRRARRQKSMPTPKKIAEAMEAVGYRHLKLSAESRTAQLTRPGMRIDLGGIAKGYAIDRAIAVMKNHGIDRSLVNGGGDVAVGKAPPGRNHWRVQLFDGTEEPPKILRLVDQAVATSGDLF